MKYVCENGGCNLVLNRDGSAFVCSWGCGKRVDRIAGNPNRSERPLSPLGPSCPPTVEIRSEK